MCDTDIQSALPDREGTRPAQRRTKCDRAWLPDAEDENKLAYMDIYSAFRDMVDSLLEMHLEDLGVTAEQFAAVCEAAASQQVGMEVLEQILAVDDFVSFRKMMVKRNMELELEAMKALQLLSSRIAAEGSSGGGGEQEVPGEDDFEARLQLALELSMKETQAAGTSTDIHSSELDRQQAETEAAPPVERPGQCSPASGAPWPHPLAPRTRLQGLELPLRPPASAASAAWQPAVAWQKGRQAGRQAGRRAWALGRLPNARKEAAKHLLAYLPCGQRHLQPAHASTGLLYSKLPPLPFATAGGRPGDGDRALVAARGGQAEAGHGGSGGFVAARSRACARTRASASASARARACSRACARACAGACARARARARTRARARARARASARRRIGHVRARAARAPFAGVALWRRADGAGGARLGGGGARGGSDETGAGGEARRQRGEAGAGDGRHGPPAAAGDEGAPWISMHG